MTISMCYAFQDREEEISPDKSGGAGYEAGSHITKPTRVMRSSIVVKNELCLDFQPFYFLPWAL